MNTKNKIIWTVVIVAAIVVVAVFVGGSNKGSREGTVKIGYIGPLSGDAAAYGQEMQKALNYRLTEINAQSGTKFVIDYEDGKCTGNDAVAAFQKMTDVDGVKIVIGGACSSETLGIAPLTKVGKALVVSALSSNPTIEGASPYVFSLSYTDQVIGDTLADQMSKFSKIAIISEQNDYNVGVKTVFKKRLATYPNAKIVADETFPKGGSDFRNLLAKVRVAAPDAVLLNPNVGTTAVNLLKQLAEISGWKGYKLYSQIAYLADDSRAAVGNFANGMVLVDAPNLTDPTFLAYKAKIEQARGTLADIGNYYTASTIDDLNILTSLIREVGNDQNAVRNALMTRHFTGYLGDIYFGNQSFKKGSKGGIYLITNGKAVYQAQ